MPYSLFQSPSSFPPAMLSIVIALGYSCGWLKKTWELVTGLGLGLAFGLGQPIIKVKRRPSAE